MVTGDIYSPARYPIFEDGEAGSLQGVINGLNHIIDIVIPESNQFGGTRIVTGYGWLSTESDVVEARDMATIVRDRIRHMIGQSMTMKEVQAARPTGDDSTYRAEPYLTSNHFMREPDGAKWNPTPCQIDPPRVPPNPQRVINGAIR
jgi:hypothetical protein